MHGARRIATFIVAAGTVAWTLFSQPRPARTAIGERAVKYQPGAYFPPEYKLHGTVRLLSAPVAEAGARTRVRIEYTLGDLAVGPGMAVEIWKHFTSDSEEFQIADSNAPAHFSAQTTAANVTAKPVVYTNWVQRNTPPVFPYRKAAGFDIEHGTLKRGDKVTFDLGGTAGVRMQYYEENLFNFRVAITRKGAPVGYGGDAMLRVTGGPLRKLRVQAPSVVAVGEAFTVEVVPEDEWVSLAKNPSGLDLRLSGDGLTGGTVTYDPALLHYIARDVKVSREGTVRIEARTADGRYSARSNPVWVRRDPVWRAYYGELHQHTYLADGRGVFEELYLYGRRVGLLDFGAVTPHHMPLSVTGPQLAIKQQFPRENWPELQRVTKEMNGWQGFVSLLGYEYSVGTPAGGHHNVFFNADSAKSTMQLDPSDPMAPIGKMLETIKMAKVPALVIPHIGGAPPDWSHPTDPRIERLFEIASVHGVFEESWRKHLDNGIRLGAIAAGDTHTTSMGTAYPGLIYVNSNGLAGVWSHGKNRRDIWDGLYQRHSFATTGNQRMIVEFRVNREAMGGEISSAMDKDIRIEAAVSGTAPLAAIELVKNGRVIHTVRPARAAGSTARIVWGDNLYQRRAAVGLRKGEIRVTQGRLRLLKPVNLDQGFEHVEAAGVRITWETAAVSGDRDGVLVDLSEASGEIVFRQFDEQTLGPVEMRLPVEQLKRDGMFSWRQKARERHPYMERMGVEPAFFIDCEMVNPSAPMDASFQFQHNEAPKPGDYFYLRAEQLDTNKAWSSPVWVN